MCSLEFAEAAVSLPQSAAAAPLVSAIVLSFNRREETLVCLRSLQQQTYAPLDMLVLDNGSSDGSATEVRRQFPNVRLMCMPRNYGDWEGRDIAARNCEGKYLMIVDNDAALEVDTIEKLVARMEAEPRLGVIQTRVLDPDTHYSEGADAKVADIDHYLPCFLGCAVLIRSSAFHEAGGFPHYLLGGGELHLSLRLLDLGYRLLYYSQTTIFHRKSLLERVPQHRLYLSSKQRFRALMSHLPGVLRPMLEILWKPFGYAVAAARAGHWRDLPWNTASLFWAGLRAWRGPWIVSPRTICLFDYLHTHLVRTESEYAQIPLDRSHLGAMVRRRLWPQAG